MKLTIELVPSTCWFSNVRDHVTAKQWNELKTLSAEIAGFKCELCGGKGPRHPVECHEVWEYDDSNLIQKLVRLISLCPACHEVKHIGFASTRGRGEKARKHLKTVNGMTEAESIAYVKEAFQIWNLRSNYKWTLDLTYLKRFNIEVAEKR